jgi:hypothetical protein
MESDGGWIALQKKLESDGGWIEYAASGCYNRR